MVFGFSVIGYYFETILKRIERTKNITLVSGPYHPIYGFGIAFAFFICTLDFSIWLKFPAVAIGIIAIEYLGGLVFNRWLGLKLWDYSKKPYNLHGQICLSISIGWVIASAVFVFGVFRFWRAWLTPTVNAWVLIACLVIIFTHDLVKHSVRKLQ
ncbi:MAG: putative ABC transporter permease [Christensenellaceae bacterium]|nr:putative ABC transporter permease [Christensenellaceae bacterium]